MTMIASYDWTSDTWTHNGDNPARKAFREAVEVIADKARTAVPDLNGRTEKAVQLVLNGDVSITPDGQGTIGSQSNGSVAYLVGKGDCCLCKDHPKAPKHLCKHVLAYHIFTRATVLAKQKLEALYENTRPASVSPVSTEPISPAPLSLPEAPASVNCYVTLAGRQVQVTLRDQDEQRLIQRLETLLQRFPAEEKTQDNPPEGWCSKHNVQMKLNHGKRGSWWSHKTPDGQWCNKK